MCSHVQGSFSWLGSMGGRSGLLWAAGCIPELEIRASSAVAAGFDEREVVDPGACRGRCRGLGAFSGVGVPADRDWHGYTHRTVVPADLDDRQIERVEQQFHFASDESGVDLVGVHGRCRCHGDGAGLGPQERLAKQSWCRNQGSLLHAHRRRAAYSACAGLERMSLGGAPTRCGPGRLARYSTRHQLGPSSLAGTSPRPGPS